MWIWVRYKAGQYVTYSGKPTNNINDAHVYQFGNWENDCEFDEFPVLYKYFVRIPVEITEKVKIK